MLGVSSKLYQCVHRRNFHAWQGDRTPRTPFGRIYEWLDVAQGFTFDDPEVRVCEGALGVRQLMSHSWRVE